MTDPWRGERRGLLVALVPATGSKAIPTQGLPFPLLLRGLAEAQPEYKGTWGRGDRMASGLEKLAAQMKPLLAELTGLAGSSAPKETSRVSFLLAWSSTPLTWGNCPSAGGWDTRGRKEPFPSPTRKDQGQTGSVSSTGLCWPSAFLTG